MYRRKAKGWIKHADCFLIDLICFQVAFCVACMMRHGLVNPYSSVLYRNVAVVAALIQIFILLTFDVFHHILQRGYYKEFLNTVKTAGLVMLFLSFYLFSIQQGGTFSRQVLVTTGLYYWAFIYLARNVWKYIWRKRKTDHAGKKSLVVVTWEARARQVLVHLMENNFDDIKITGLILMDAEESGKAAAHAGSLADRRYGDVPVVAGRDSAAEYLCRDWVDEVFVDIPESDPFLEQLLDIIQDMNIVVHIPVGGPGRFAGEKKHVQSLGAYTVVTMSSNIRDVREAFLKRSLDILGGLSGCILTCLLFLFLAPAIYLRSPGPVFFSQMRVGRNGKLFRIYKFRSMYMDAEKRKSELASRNQISSGMMFKIEDDPRIIGNGRGPGRGIGHFIRRHSLDEFPQFFNVLKGDMSLVGTRPPTVDEWEKYEFRHRGRMSIKPGLTGLWQVSGRSEVTDFEEVVALDRKYIAEWSFGLDLWILCRTVIAVFRSDGAR